MGIFCVMVGVVKVVFVVVVVLFKDVCVRKLWWLSVLYFVIDFFYWMIIFVVVLG